MEKSRYSNEVIYTKAGISTLTVGGVDTFTKRSGAHPDRILSEGVKLGVDSFQLIPLRGLTQENIRTSGLLEQILTLEGPRGGISGRILCGSHSHATNLLIDVLAEKPNIISVDFLEGSSAIEIAGIDVHLIDPTTGVILPHKRIIDAGKRIVFDTFHARDLTSIGRKNVMKGEQPSRGQVENKYEQIFSLEPEVSAVHIQERDPKSIKDFISGMNTLLAFEIRELKAHLGPKYNRIPLIIELSPFPTLHWQEHFNFSAVSKAYHQRESAIRRFVERVNELWYG